MILMKIILILVGLAFITFGYLIYFKEKYNLVRKYEFLTQEVLLC